MRLGSMMAMAAVPEWRRVGVGTDRDLGRRAELNSCILRRCLPRLIEMKGNF